MADVTEWRGAVEHCVQELRLLPRARFAICLHAQTPFEQGQTDVRGMRTAGAPLRIASFAGSSLAARSATTWVCHSGSRALATQMRVTEACSERAAWGRYVRLFGNRLLTRRKRAAALGLHMAVPIWSRAQGGGSL